MHVFVHACVCVCVHMLRLLTRCLLLREEGIRGLQVGYDEGRWGRA